MLVARFEFKLPPSVILFVKSWDKTFKSVLSVSDLVFVSLKILFFSIESAIVFSKLDCWLIPFWVDVAKELSAVSASVIVFFKFVFCVFAFSTLESSSVFSLFAFSMLVSNSVFLVFALFTLALSSSNVNLIFSNSFNRLDKLSILFWLLAKLLIAVSDFDI